MRDVGPNRHSYHRFCADAAGPGSTETLWRVRSELLSAPDSPIRGRVHGVFDRTLYVSLPLSGLGREQALVAFGTPGVRPGPLVVHLDTPPRFSFQNLSCSQGSRCDLWLSGRGSDAERISIQFRGGSTIDVGVDVLEHLPVTATAPQTFSVHAFGPDTPAVATHRRLSQWHLERGTAGGIQWLGRLVGASDGSPGPEPDAVARAIVDVLVSDTLGGYRPRCRSDWGVHPDEIRPLIDLLGRGPGATPSGDDVLVGILLVLLAVDEPRWARAVRSLGHTLCTAAADRTTAISRALLEQARLGRAAAPTQECLRVCTDAEPDQQRLREASVALLETGHTSGSDTLAGILTATTVVLPRLAARLRTGESAN